MIWIWLDIRIDVKLIMVRKGRLDCGDTILEVCIFGILMLFGECCLQCWILNNAVVDINSEVTVREYKNLYVWCPC